MKRDRCAVGGLGQCRSPQGERGLKLQLGKLCLGEERRSPQGERGLKLHGVEDACGHGLVAPRKGSVG